MNVDVDAAAILVENPSSGVLCEMMVEDTAGLPGLNDCVSFSFFKAYRRIVTEAQTQSKETHQKGIDEQLHSLENVAESVVLQVAIAAEVKPDNSDDFGRSKRKRIPRQVEIDAPNECLCGLVVEPLSEGVLLCKKNGCETRWVFNFIISCLILLTSYDQYHLQCVSLEQEPRNWVCTTCAQGRGKRSRR